MPLVRINLPSGKSAEFGAAAGDTVYSAMIETLNVPKDDRFQVLTEHHPSDLIADPNYLGIQRSADFVVVQVTLNGGRSVKLKRALYRAAADGLNARLGLRKEDVFISLIEVTKENWSYGNGEAQYA